jgi:glutamate racemase
VLPPIGVFDSGIGGLTVAAAMRDLLPAENIFYIGDTARVPYGGKSRETIERYSREIGGMLVTEDAKVIVVACNTASALGIPAMREKFATPIIGVIEPGARAAVEATKNGRIGVIGTRATIYSRAYERAIHALDRDTQVISAPCPIFVPMIEEGWLDDGITTRSFAATSNPWFARRSTLWFSAAPTTRFFAARFSVSWATRSLSSTPHRTARLPLKTC